MSFWDKSVVITGGNKGIGLSIAKVFARNTEHPLVLVARNEKDLEAAKEACMKEGASKVTCIQADLRKAGDLEKEEFSGLDVAILINNAGSFLYKPLEDTTGEEFQDQFSVNAASAFHITQKLLPNLKKQERALIVNICSYGSIHGLEDSGAYAMSKHALLGYTRSLRKELLNSPVGVTAINLGQTYSTSWDGVDIKPEKLIDPEDVGLLILSFTKISSRSVVEELTLMPSKGKVAPM